MSEKQETYSVGGAIAPRMTSEQIAAIDGLGEARALFALIELAIDSSNTNGDAVMEGASWTAARVRELISTAIAVLSPCDPTPASEPSAVEGV